VTENNRKYLTLHFLSMNRVRNYAITLFGTKVGNVKSNFPLNLEELPFVIQDLTENRWYMMKVIKVETMTDPVEPEFLPIPKKKPAKTVKNSKKKGKKNPIPEEEEDQISQDND
jgi:hypothetical protein